MNHRLPALVTSRPCPQHHDPAPAPEYPQPPRYQQLYPPKAESSTSRRCGNPYASGEARHRSIHATVETCACCKRNMGWIYTATCYTAQDVNGRFCPWWCGWPGCGTAVLLLYGCPHDVLVLPARPAPRRLQGC
ncbi:CbrC family protein [Streptomyces sp. NPDC005706]|uniref:CbrC family protein n=1 Tax=Streptomyces sp. NPDC005706 TaxID=3157169 RepID=UPI00340B6F72